MPTTRSAKPTRLKVAEHRERVRAQGLRPIHIWVPDVRAASLRAEAHRQSAAAASAQGAKDQAFIDAVSVPSSGPDGEA